MKKLLLREGVIMLLSLFVSCTPTSDNILLEEEITKVEFMLPDSSISADSRMNIVVGSGVKYNWTNTDSIGIFPDDGYQVAFPLKTTGESSSATFTGGGWALKAGSTYAAYYPFEYNNRRSDSIPVSYLGQKQIGNNSTGLADKYNYMYAIGDKTGDNALTFKMLRLGRFIILKFAVPEPTTLSSVKLTAPEDVFITQGYFNLWDNPHVIESLQTSNSLTIDLEDVKTTEADEEVTVYFFMPPVDLSGKTLALEVTDENNVKIQYTVAGKDMTDSKAYALTGVIQEPVVGDGTYQNGVVSLSQAGTMKKLLGDDYLNITSLKVVGPINGDDVYYLRKMLGGSDFSEADWGKLTTLDLSEATIVEGGEWYYDINTSYIGSEYYTSNNVIGDYMFYECVNLQNITLPDNVTSIGRYAFQYCNALASVVIGEGITSIGYDAFENCYALMNIYITDLSGWCKINISSNPLNYGAKLYLDNNLVTELTIPDDITEIKNNAFMGCGSLIKVTIPDHVTSIGSGAFNNCDALTEVTILGGELGRSFVDCDALKSVVMGDGVTSSLTYGAFFSCDALTSVVIGNSVTSIEEEAFAYCYALTSIVIGDGVTSIGEHAFFSCHALTSVVIGDGVTSIDEEAFRDCNALTSVVIGDGVTSIGYGAFRDCYALTSVVIGEGITSIGNDAFRNCSINMLYCYATKPPTWNDNYNYAPFKNGVKTEATLYVPSRCGTAYKSSDWGDYFKNIIEMD